MIFNNLTSDSLFVKKNNDYFANIQEEIHRILESRSIVACEADNPISFGVYRRTINAEGELSKTIRESIQTFCPQFNVHDIEVTQEHGSYQATITGEVAETQMRFKHLF